MHRTHLPLLALLILLFTLTSTSATAHTLADDDEMILGVSGFARARVSGQTPADGDEKPTIGGTLVMARLMGKAQFKNLGDMEVELEATRTGSPLLDLFVDLNMGSPVNLRLGQFKVPFSRELLLSIKELPIYDRTTITRSLGVRRRAGALLTYKQSLGTVALELGAGAFNVAAGSAPGQDGILTVAAANARLAMGLEFHVAYMDHVFDPGPDEMTGDDPFAHDGLIDAAIYYDKHNVRALAEAILATQTATDEPALGLHGLVAYKIDLAAEHQAIEPALSIDYTDLRAGQTNTRATANLHWLLQGRNLQASVGYAVEIEETTQRSTSHLALFELQGAF